MFQLLNACLDAGLCLPNNTVPAGSHFAVIQRNTDLTAKNAEIGAGRQFTPLECLIMLVELETGHDLGGGDAAAAAPVANAAHEIDFDENITEIEDERFGDGRADIKGRWSGQITPSVLRFSMAVVS